MNTYNIMTGYACINETLKSEGYSFQTMTVKHFNKSELLKRIRNNFRVTLKILEWNVEHNILLYRFSSDLIPLATHELNDIEWWKDEEVLRYCSLIRNVIKKHNVQTSFHPSQFTLLNSPDAEVIKKSYEDLKYHYKLCKLLNCKMLILHIGGVYGDKEKSTRRFVYIFNNLPQPIKDLIFLENDDKSYNLEEVLNICKEVKRPIVADWHHDRCLPSSKPFNTYLNEILHTWEYTDLKPKCHLSSSKESDKIVRNHAEYVTIDDYKKCIEDTKGRLLIMLECKKKELAVLNLKHSKEYN